MVLSGIEVSQTTVLNEIEKLSIFLLKNASEDSTESEKIITEQGMFRP